MCLDLICSAYQGGDQELAPLLVPALARLGCDLPFMSCGALNGFKTNDLGQCGLGWESCWAWRWQVLLLRGKTVSASFQQQKK